MGMFNPSTGDGTNLDPTIRKIIGYTFGKNSPHYTGTGFRTSVTGDGAFPTAWAIRGLKIVNLYAQRSADPKQVPNNNNRQNLDNNPIQEKIRECQEDPKCKAIVAAWGAIAGKPGEINKVKKRKNEIAKYINNLTKKTQNKTPKRGYIGNETRGGYPKHPLFNNKKAKFGRPMGKPRQI